jgi:hypothetical protein
MVIAFILWGGDGWAAGRHLFWLGPHWGLLWIGLIVSGIWMIARGGDRGRGRFVPERPAEVLVERPTRGEISTDQYRERLVHLYASDI